MTTDDSLSGDRPRRVGAILLIIIFFLLANSALSATTTYTISGTVTFKTDSGLAVKVSNTEIESGNPFASSTAVVLKNIRFEAESSGSADVTLSHNDTARTNVTDIDTTGANISIDPPNKTRVIATNGTDEISISNDINASTSGDTGLVVKVPNGGQVAVETGGKGAVAVDKSTGNPLDDGQPQPDGSVIFDLPSGTHNIDLQPAPSTLFIFNESDPDALISKKVELRVRLFGQENETVIQETVTDGTVDLSGIPADQRYVVTVSDEAGNFTYRRAVIESLIQQQDVYLLPTAIESVDTEFQLTDYTSNYPPADTYLYIEAPITKDYNSDGTNETRYRTIAGDTVGPTGVYPTTLEKDERYRLRIVNRPNQRVLGGYTATRSELTEITIRGQDLKPPEGQDYAVQRTVERDSNGQRQLEFKYIDESTDTSRLYFHVRNTSSGNIVYKDDVTNGPVENYSAYTIPLSNNTRYSLVWNATRDGTELGGQYPIGGYTFVGIPLDPDWLGAISIIAVGFVAALGGVRKHTYIAIGTVAVAALLMFLGTIRIAVPLWFLALLIAVGGHLRQMQIPTQP